MSSPQGAGVAVEVVGEEHGWLVERVAGPAQALHAASVELLDAGPVRRRVRLVEATGPALVLGSTQPAADFDHEALAAAGLGLARRRSGGSAVVVGPGECVWVDVVVPVGDERWDPDVGRATWWVGATWRAALAAVTGRDDFEVWKGPLRRSTWSSQVCFAGLGPGEVVHPSGAKVVGVSQRRTRHAALFQTAALLRWDPAATAALLAGDDQVRAAAAAALAGAATGIAGGDPDALGLAFVHRLPD